MVPTPTKTPARMDLSPRRVAQQRSVSHAAMPTVYAPPKQRLHAALDACSRLDLELKVIENSGHVKVGVFAKPLGDQQRCRLLASAAKKDVTHHLPEDPAASEPMVIEDDDTTADPFFHRFYDEAGASTYEQLLRGRMRVLALTKMVYARDSIQYVRAEIELIETYARMNLWKQAHAHSMVAYEILKRLDEARDFDQNCSRGLKAEDDEDADANESFGRMLAYFYDKQRLGDPTGEVTTTSMIDETTHWQLQADATFSSIMGPSNLGVLFGAAPFLQWQQLLLRMERQSSVFQDFVRMTESSIPENVRSVIAQVFQHLDPSRFGVVPVQSLIELVSSYNQGRDDDAIDCVCDALRAHAVLVDYPSITWSELVHFAYQSLHPTQRINGVDPARDLRPRLKLLIGRFFLRKGQLDDAMRYMQTAVVEQEQIDERGCDALVPLYLTVAETLSVRFKQLAVVAQQHAFEIADKWLKSTDGSRRLRAKALDIIDAHARQDGKVLPKKDAEARARDELLKEYATLSFVRPDTTAIEDAVEFCTKAWRVQQQTHGGDHITTASIHVTLAQIHSIQKDWQESVRCYEQAIEIYESSCNGPVVSSVLLKLAIAKICQHHTNEPTKAAAIYEVVGDFFHSFALEFASSGSTRRDSCSQAIEAWRLWLALAPCGAEFKCTLDDQRRMLAKIHDATVDGFGEFAVEAAESGRELGQLLIKLGQLRQAERHIRAAWYVLESHYGPNDRRSRKMRKELVVLSSEIKGSALDGDEVGHEWLTI